MQAQQHLCGDRALALFGGAPVSSLVWRAVRYACRPHLDKPVQFVSVVAHFAVGRSGNSGPGRFDCWAKCVQRSLHFSPSIVFAAAVVHASLTATLLCCAALYCAAAAVMGAAISTCENGYPGFQTQEACCSEFCGQCGKFVFCLFGLVAIQDFWRVCVRFTRVQDDPPPPPPCCFARRSKPRCWLGDLSIYLLGESRRMSHDMPAFG